MFSIVIPMFNASNTIVLTTLASCLKQTQLPKEIIIVDDRSTDDSYALVKKWKENYSGDVTVILEQLDINSGPSKVRNRGWDLASGEYVAFLDADDRFLPEKLENVATVLKENPEIVLLGHGFALEDENTDKNSTLTKVSTNKILFKNLTTTPSVIVRREINERFDEQMRYTEDHDLWLRITRKYNETYFLDSTLTVIGRAVRAEGGQSANLWAMRKGEMEMYRKYCKENGLMLLYPFFLFFSLGKHFLKILVR